MKPQLLVTGVYGAAALIGVGAFTCPPLLNQRDDARSSKIADAGIQRLSDGEMAYHAAHGRYAGFSQASADRAAIMPHVHLGPEFDELSFDALLDRKGALRLRVMSRIDAVRAGRISPLMKIVQLVDPATESPDKNQ